MGISRSSPRDVLTAHKDVPADGRDAVVKRAPISKRKRQDPALAKHEETNMDSKGKVFKVATLESAIPAIELSDAVPAQEGATRALETAKPEGKQSRKTTRGKKSAGDATPPMSPKTAKKDATGTSSRSPSKSPSKKAGRVDRCKITPGSLTPPEGWREIYDLVWELRRERDAPVDWAGSEALGVEGDVVDKYHVLIALMLSSQTKDQVVADAMYKLKARGLTMQNIVHMPDAELDGYIAKVGFHNNKVKYIKQTTEILLEKHGGQVPDTAEALCALPGIGPKMAYIILKAAHGVVDGIGVDTHMHRMFNVLGWVNSKTPEGTRAQLEGWLPSAEWGEINVLFVGFGQMTQQPAEREKLWRRAIACSRPDAAVRLAVRLGASISLPADKASGDSPLHLAARANCIDAVVAMLACGASRADKNSAGETAMDIATRSGFSELEATLAAKKK